MSSKLMSESSPAVCFAAWRRSVCRSSSLHLLFLISPDVILFSPAGRDNTGDFFAIGFLPVHVDNQQNDRSAGLNTSGSDRVPALFSHLVDTIGTYQAAFVFEDQCRYLE